jgi:TfoX/Sxy family transcriptional regulator of competence genes
VSAIASTLGTMAYDEELADRIRELINQHGPVDEKKMFGGLSFLLGGHMAVCASGRGGLMVRVSPDDHAALQDRELVGPMVMGGRESKTWLVVAPDGVRTKRQLEAWVARGVATAKALPAKG